MSFQRRKAILDWEQFPRNNELIKDSLYHLMMLPSKDGGSHWSDGVRLLKYTYSSKLSTQVKDIISWIESNHLPKDSSSIKEIVNLILLPLHSITSFDSINNKYTFPKDEESFLPFYYVPSLPNNSKFLPPTITTSIETHFQSFYWKEENSYKLIDEIMKIEKQYPFYRNDNIILLKATSLFKLGFKEELLKMLNQTSKDIILPPSEEGFSLYTLSTSHNQQLKELDPSKSLIQSIDRNHPCHFYFFLKGLLENLILSSSTCTSGTTTSNTYRKQSLQNTDFKIKLNSSLENPHIPSFVVIGHMYSAIGDHDSTILAYRRALRGAIKMNLDPMVIDSIRIMMSSQFLVIGSSTLALSYLETAIDRLSPRFLNEYGVYLLQKGRLNEGLLCFKKAIDGCNSSSSSSSSQSLSLSLRDSFVHNYYVCRLKMISSFSLMDLANLIREGLVIMRSQSGGGVSGVWGDNIRSFILELSLLVLKDNEDVHYYSVLEEAIKLISSPSSTIKTNTALERRKRNALQRLNKMKMKNLK